MATSRHREGVEHVVCLREVALYSRYQRERQFYNESKQSITLTLRSIHCSAGLDGLPTRPWADTL